MWILLQNCVKINPVYFEESRSFESANTINRAYGGFPVYIFYFIGFISKPVNDSFVKAFLT